MLRNEGDVDLNLHKIEKFVEDSSLEETQEMIASFLESDETIGLIIGLAIKNSKFDEICRAKEFEPALWHVWEEFGEKTLASMQTNQIPTISNFKFKPQPFFSPLDLVKGMYSYWEYSKSLNEFYLDQSASYFCYEALYERCSLNLKKIKKSELSKENFLELINNTINFAKIAAQYHGTPGYILLQKVYLKICEALESTQDTHYEVVIKKYYFNAFKALCIAEKLIAESTAAIHNAYLGAGLESENDKQFANWTEAKKHILDLGKFLELNSIYNKVNTKIEKIQNQLSSHSQLGYR